MTVFRGRPVIAEIDRGALARNVAALKAAARGRQLLAVVKDDAYGHGARRCVEAIDDACDGYCVASGAEARDLRRVTGKEIIVLGGLFPGERVMPGVIPVAYDMASLRRLARRGGQSVDIELDTGMGRTGFLGGELDGLIAFLARHRELRLHGVMTHFATSDSDPGFARGQLAAFRDALARFRSAGLSPGIVHAANSAGCFIDDSGLCTAVRPGIMLYGGYPADALRDRIALEPVMSFKAGIVALKEVPSGTPISYGGSFVTRRVSRIATLATGYGDGYPRHLSNRGVVFVEGHGTASVAGRVCMDMTMVDVTGLPGVRRGDTAVLWGAGHDDVHPDRVAGRAGTISYELFCGLSLRVRRVCR